MMTLQEFKEKLTPEQREAMIKLQQRSGIAWNDFLETAMPPGGIFDYVGIPNFHGMFVGIESDGYTHS